MSERQEAEQMDLLFLMAWRSPIYWPKLMKRWITKCL